MNDLSWMLYLVGIIPNVGGVAGLIAVIAGFASLFCVACMVNLGDNLDRYCKDNPTRYAENNRQYILARRFLITGIFVFVTGVLTAAFTPGERTLHLILASEMGQTVVENQEVQEIFGLMKERLKEELKKE